MPENEPVGPSLSKPPPRAPPTQTVKLNYVPFSFEEVPPRLPEKDDYGRFHDATLRDYCDKLDTLQFHALMSNLIDSIINRGGTTAAYQIWFLAEQSPWALQYLANSENPLAGRHCIGVVSRAVERLNHHANLKPKLYRKPAQTQIRWPVLYSPSPYFATDSIKVQNEPSVGSDYGLNALGQGSKRKKPYEFTLPKNKLVLRVIETLTANMSSRLRIEAEAGGCDIAKVPPWVKKCGSLSRLVRRQ